MPARPSCKTASSIAFACGLQYGTSVPEVLPLQGFRGDFVVWSTKVWVKSCSLRFFTIFNRINARFFVQLADDNFT